MNLVCGYCLLPAVEGEYGMVHGDGVPDVDPVTPGDFVTALHVPGRPVRGYDVVDLDESEEVR